MKKIIIILIMILFLTGCSNNSYKTITAEEAYNIIKNDSETLVVDVREKIEFDNGHIKNAILLPLDTILEDIKTKIPNKDATIILYCNSGRRDVEAAKKLVNAGYKNVYTFGGINNWTYEVVK